jgi:hypothetical protein
MTKAACVLVRVPDITSLSTRIKTKQLTSLISSTDGNPFLIYSRGLTVIFSAGALSSIDLSFKFYLSSQSNSFSRRKILINSSQPLGLGYVALWIFSETLWSCTASLVISMSSSAFRKIPTCSIFLGVGILMFRSSLSIPVVISMKERLPAAIRAYSVIIIYRSRGASFSRTIISIITLPPRKNTKPGRYSFLLESLPSVVTLENSLVKRLRFTPLILNSLKA